MLSGVIRAERLRLRAAFRGLLALPLLVPVCVEACGKGAPMADAGAEDAGGGSLDAAHADAAVERADANDGAIQDARACHTSAVRGVDAGDAGDGGEGCDFLQDYTCGLPAGVVSVGCALYTTCDGGICPGDSGAVPCFVVEGSGCVDGSFVDDGGQITLECALCGGGGRRPRGLRGARFRASASALGDYFARLAFLEAASVDAFRLLREELGRVGAPRAFMKAAERSARDEERHARSMARIARSHGGVLVKPRVARRAPRALEALAAENLVEGCVRETFGALIATWQAARARDPRIARAMARIAEDETRHAALAWAIARWADARLTPKARARLEKKRRTALHALRLAADAEPPALLVAAAGLPTAAEARGLVDAMATRLWATSPSDGERVTRHRRTPRFGAAPSSGGRGARGASVPRGG